MADSGPVVAPTAAVAGSSDDSGTPLHKAAWSVTAAASSTGGVTGMGAASSSPGGTRLAGSATIPLSTTPSGDGTAVGAAANLGPEYVRKGG